jgi:hypothetical protein
MLFFVCINASGCAANNLKDVINQTSCQLTTDSVDTSEISQMDFLSNLNSSSQINTPPNQKRDLTLYTIIVAVFGILVGVIVSLVVVIHNNRIERIKELRTEVTEIKDEIQRKIVEVDGLMRDIENRTDVITDLQTKQDYQNQYMQRINQYLFLVTNSVVDINGGGGAASGIRVVLYNQYNIVKVFLPWSDSPTDGTEAAFRYLQVNGTIENIGDLQFIADNDLDERKRQMAQETIGYIRARLMNNPT